jgi:hypothetical protein
MNTRTHVATEEITTLYGIVLQIRANKVTTYRQNEMLMYPVENILIKKW